MKNKFTRKLLLIVCAVVLALTGCSSGGTSSGTSSSSGNEESKESSFGGEITIGIAQDLDDSLDPHLAVSAGTKEILFNIFEGLVKADENGNLQPAVASEYDISDDGTVYTFTLRDGILFHNGEAVTAEDVKYSIERCADTSSGEPLVSAFADIKSVEIPDEKTIVITLNSANSEFLSYCTTAIIPKDYTEQDTAPVGTGPFKFVSRAAQDNVVLEKNENYWGTSAYLDKITLKIVSDADTIVTDLKGGSIQMFARLTSDQAAQLTEGYTIYKGTMNLVQALYLNNDEKPFDNEKVRQALCYCIDPQEIMDMIADGEGEEVGSSMFPAFKKYFDESLNDTYEVDYEKAKELLSEAGYPDGFDMTITVPSNYEPHIQTAEVIVEELKNINVNATIDLVEWDSWVSDVYVGRKFQSTLVGVDASYLNARSMLERFTSDSSVNFINFSDDEYDALFAEASTTTDEEQQVEDYKEMEKILSEKAANVYIQDMSNLVALSDEYGGYTFYPMYVQDFSKIYKVAE